MIVIKVTGVAIIGTLLCLVLKEENQPFGHVLSLLCALCVLFMSLPYLDKALSYVRVLYSSLSDVDYYMSVLIKVTGIATVSYLTCNFCKDSGMNAVSSMVSLCAKLISLSITIPVISDFFSGVMSVLPK